MEFQIDATEAIGKPSIYYPTAIEVEPSAPNFLGSRPASYISYPNNVLAYDMNRPAGTAYYHKPRGSWKINKIYALNAGAPRSPTIADADVYV